VRVRLANGSTPAVVSVHATSSEYDLAIVRIEGGEYPALELGESAEALAGEPVIVVGNPHGLEQSVVAGVVSAKRAIDGMPMLQLALPIEPGNSGGPVVDRAGRVIGVVTMKSLVTANLGFAIEVDALKSLLDRPNPVPIERWRTLGQLSPKDWETRWGGNWRQRAGRLMASEPGTGFGGRTLCIRNRPTPGLPYEVSVRVKLEDESGAAGLAFAIDEGDRHYGFYPSGGSLRLTRFDGPDVLSWNILAQVRSAAYRPGDWNTLKVRVEADAIRCFVNGEEVVTSRDSAMRSGRAGLAKFRETSAQFRRFELADEIVERRVAPERLATIDAGIDASLKSGALTKEVAAMPIDSVGRLRNRAKQLDEQAGQLRQWADRIHEATTIDRLAKVVADPDADGDLLEASLLVAQLDNEDVDVDAYRNHVAEMAAAIASTLPAGADDRVKLAALDTYLFEQEGYHGSRADYSHRSNSYINEVIDDREGLPITLCVLYMDLSSRLKTRVVGVGFPGHFFVRREPAGVEPELVDVFDRGRKISAEEVARRLKELGDDEVVLDDFLVDKQKTIARMLHNLLGIAQEERDIASMLRYLSAIVAVNPESALDHWRRAVLLLETGDRVEAAREAEWLLERGDETIDRDAVQRLLDIATSPSP
jgi:regulator of sirC expression with transglutaminase-like and TPR domain